MAGPADSGGGGSTARAQEPFHELMALSRDDEKVLYDAEQRATSECMKREGFLYTPRAFRGGTLRLGVEFIGDVEKARLVGYGLTIELDPMQQAGRAPEDETDTKGLSESEEDAWNRTLLGAPMGPEVPESGGSVEVIRESNGGPALAVDRSSCASKARSEVFGDDIAYQRLQFRWESIRNEVVAKVANDANVAEANGRWRECMRRKGLDYERPGAAANALAAGLKENRVSVGEMRRTEIDVATADAECVREMNWISAHNEVVERLEREAMKEHESAIVSFVETRKAALDRLRD